MATLTRKTQKLFAGNAGGDMLAEMGTMKTGTPIYSTDIENLQTQAYTEGWSSAILNDKAPYLEEMNGVQYGFSYQIAYLLQEGIPEYDVNTNYSASSIVKVIDNNNLILYRSLKDNNTGVVDITTSANWARLYIVDYGRIGEPQITLNDTLPDNCIWLAGQTVSKTTYAALFAIYGTTYNTGGEGSGNFRLPNFGNRTLWGATDFGYIAAGLPSISASTSSAGSHNHTRGNMNITGQMTGVKTIDDGQSGASGAFSVSRMSGGKYTSSSPHSVSTFNFSAASSWTGNTSSAGAHTHSVTVSASTSGILGNSSTVQPPAIKVRVYTRWK